MFSGIIEASGTVRSLSREQEAVRLVIATADDFAQTGIGDSIAVDGVCLTVVHKGAAPEGTLLSFDLLQETMRRTAFGDRIPGDRVNLERSLRVGTGIHGHFVFGHVDTTVRLVSRTPDGNCDRLEWSFADASDPIFIRRHLAPKGSVSISGTSLTVGEVEATSFSVYIIPHTSAVTTLGQMSVGTRANMELDMLARYVVNALSQSGALS